MRLYILPKLLVLALSFSFSFSSVLTELEGTKGLADINLTAMVSKLETIGFRATAKNEHLENHYYNKFKEKNLDLLSFYTIADLLSMRELLIENPNFAAYMPFNLLAFKMPEGSRKDSNTTWYGHLATDTMLEIIGEKDEALRKKFKLMISKVDTLVSDEMKPTEAKTLTFDNPLPTEPLLKMVKKIGEIEDIEEYVEEFQVEHDGLFVKNKFIIAGFLDVKFEYDDLDLDFEAYDAFWTSSLCHFEFSNAIFNHGEPQAGLFAPCSVYFYIPKGSGELHVGYATVDNWLSSTGITDKAKIAYMKEISASVVRILGELGFVNKKIKNKKIEVKVAKTIKEVKTVQTVKPLMKVESITNNDSVLIDFYGTKGQPEAELKSMITNLKNIGFAASSKNEHLENHYFNTFKEKNLDLLNFYTIFDITSLRTLLLKNPDFGAYAPFNLLAYKKFDTQKDGDTTWYGHLNAETMLKIIGERDESTKEMFRTMMSKVDTHVQSEMKPTEHKTLSFSNPLPKKPLLKMVKHIGEVEDIEEYVEEFIIEHDGLFVKNKFIIAGFLDIKFEYDDLELDFEKYDAYWVSSLCHFEFSNAVFNHGSPHAGAFAPCSVYFYIPKGSGELHVGYASVDNWLVTTGITDPKKIAYMKEISASVVRIFQELGFKLKDEDDFTKKKEVKSKIILSPPVIESVKKALLPSESFVKVSLPTVPKVVKYQNLNDRSIKFSKRVPPNYITSAERYKEGGVGTSLAQPNSIVGEVNSGRISTYLRAELMSIEKVEEKLKNAGFDIVATIPLDKKKKMTSIVFTNDALKSLIKKENQGHLGTLRVLINQKTKRISITNPLYLAKAFLQDDFDKESAIKILNVLKEEFNGLTDSSDQLKFQLLPKYQLMNNLPYFNDYLVIARGEDLKEKILNNKRVDFSIDLPNGATLIGVKLNKRSIKFPKKIGIDNAGMLPYPLLIENGEAKILNPKYYLALMYPKLTMEKFMKIATIPDDIVNDCTKIFR